MLAKNFCKLVGNVDDADGIFSFRQLRLPSPDTSAGYGARGIVFEISVSHTESFADAEPGARDKREQDCMAFGVDDWFAVAPEKPFGRS